MHFADPNQREALEALSRIKLLHARLRKERERAQEACRTAKEIVREAERFKRAVERMHGS